MEYLPQLLIDNSLAAFQLANPWLERFDASLVKKTKIRETKEIEFRVNALNAFNLTNFFITNQGFGNISVNSTAFGQTRQAYKDLNSTNDRGSRVIEFGLRFKF